MESKNIVLQFTENLYNDNATAFLVLAEDVSVGWPGMGEIQGKENVTHFFEQNVPDKIVSKTIHHLIAEGNTVMGDGVIVFEKSGATQTAHFADIYEIMDGKIAKLTSYIVMENK